MPLPKEKAWFPAKRYGWGWGPPQRKEGWIVLILYCSALIVPGALIVERNVWVYVAYALLLSGILGIILHRKGEKPEWRWGDK